MHRHLIALFVAALTVTGTAQAASLTIHGTLIDRDGNGSYDASVRYLPRGASLVSMDGRTRWTWQTTGQLLRPPWLLAQGDLNGDRATDLVFSLARPTSGMCGTTLNGETSLLLVDGRTGRARQLLQTLASPCWAYGYASDQWNVGTVRIGPWGLAAFPMHGETGSIAGREVVTPRSPSFDQVYNAANTEPCKTVATMSPVGCYITGSHFPITAAVPGGLLALSSERAFIYRPDGTPTSDVHWRSGDGENGTRNYGYLRSFTHKGRQYATLVGGCTVWNARRAMTGTMPDPLQPSGTCAIHRHIEAFELAGGRIVSHFNRFISYSYKDGPFRQRVEVPAQTGSRVVYNVFDGERWSVHVIADPSRPAMEQVLEGRYAWGLSGRFLVVSPSRGYAPDWRTELLDGERVVRSSVGVPVLVNYPDTPSSMFYDGLPVDPGSGTRSDSAFGAFTWEGRVLMRTRAGVRFWLG